MFLQGFLSENTAGLSGTSTQFFWFLKKYCCGVAIIFNWFLIVYSAIKIFLKFQSRVFPIAKNRKTYSLCLRKFDIEIVKTKLKFIYNKSLLSETRSHHHSSSISTITKTETLPIPDSNSTHHQMAKKAVLIGINYPGTEGELRGCVNDVKRMHRCLVDRFGFSEENITELIDTDKSKIQPTGKNIRQALSELVGSANPGDVLFVHYSGHGVRLPPETGEDDDTGFDECIVPCDMNNITGT